MRPRASSSIARRSRAGARLSAIAAVVGIASYAHAAAVAVDRVAARYFAPETGGSERPRFVTQRLLGFEARLEALAEGAPPSAAYDDRFIRAALDRHIAEDMLSSLDVESPVDTLELPARVESVRTGLAERVGGAKALQSAMDAEGIEAPELQDLLRRRARAALYADRALTPVLHPTEEQLREVQRTSANPFKQAPFDQARAALGRWFVEERLRTAETTYLQSARSRVRVVVVTKDGESR